MFRYINILLIILANRVDAHANSTGVETSSNNTNLIYKCCPINQHISIRRRCLSSEASYNFSGIVVYDDNMKKMEETFDEVLTLVPGKFEDIKFRVGSFDAHLLHSNVYVMQNGDLKLEFPNSYYRYLTIERQSFCVDFLLRTDKVYLRYYIDLPKPEPVEYHPLTKLGLLLSSFFLLLVLVIYVMLPELHNLCGKILIMFVASLSLAFLNLAAMHFMLQTVNNCIAMTAVTYYFFLSSFFWLTVMSFDIWWTFRSFIKVRPIRSESESTKFVLYSIYAGGVPIIMTIGLLTINGIDMSHLPWFVTPKVPEQGCFLESGSKFIYLHIPMLILIFWNWVFYLLASFKVRQLSRRTALLETTAAGSLQAQHTHKMRFMVYLKLSVVMGFYWLIEFLDVMYPVSEKWYISDIYGSIVGFMIFLILVCKSHIFKMLRSRYGCKKSSVPKTGPLSKIHFDYEPIKSKQKTSTIHL